MSIHFKDSSCFAHFHVNWTSPVKIRRIMIAGKKKMLVYDDMENSEKIKVYDSSIHMNSIEDIHSALVQYRTGDMYSPKIEQTEALSEGVNEFIAAVTENRQPLTGAVEGLEVVRILEATDKSIKNKGSYIELREVIKSDEHVLSNTGLHKVGPEKIKRDKLSSSEFEKVVGY